MTDFIIRLVRFAHLYLVRKTRISVIYLSFLVNTCVVRQKVFFTSLATSLQPGILFKERRTGKS
jgi:hypothetical protein